ncbi:sensor histidine kinase [Brachybacterium muris]|uniref:sensor histidine kinase n=1 Tax=Brachybacterium muris TaxID=219301 RepID=UPI0021E49044|nr:histidine kinase [Brachybacterium muris]MCT2177465.1 histidine kinase [Brachybacterium muris]
MDDLGQPVRRRWQEALILLAVAADSAFLGLIADGDPWVIAQTVGTALLGAALLARHRHWRWLLPLLLVLGALTGSIVVPIVSLYCFATRSTHRLVTVLVGLLGVVALALPSLDSVLPERIAQAILLIFFVVAATVAVGMYTQARRQLLAQFQRRAMDAEQGQTEAEDRARRAERTRIAREMHDIVAHKISLVALQAGALEVNPNLDRAQVVESVGLIRQTATTALSELREVLGVLRSEDEGAPLAPQPTWGDVRDLVTTSQSAGISVELFDFIDDPVPDMMARTAYRVVQEGLTNIHKHARHTKARVALIGEPGTDLVIEVSNVLPVGFTTDLPGARMGLSGIETRVLHAGGTITSGPTDDGRFEVKAVIPWPTTA